MSGNNKNALVPYSNKGDLVVRPDNVLGLEQLVDGSLHFTSREEEGAAAGYSRPCIGPHLDR